MKILVRRVQYALDEILFDFSASPKHRAFVGFAEASAAHAPVPCHDWPIACAVKLGQKCPSALPVATSEHLRVCVSVHACLLACCRRNLRCPPPAQHNWVLYVQPEAPER